MKTSKKVLSKTFQSMLRPSEVKDLGLFCICYKDGKASKKSKLDLNDNTSLAFLHNIVTFPTTKYQSSCFASV